MSQSVEASGETKDQAKVATMETQQSLRQALTAKRGVLVQQTQ